MIEQLNLEKEAKSLENKRRSLFVLHGLYKFIVAPIFHIAKAVSVVIIFVIVLFPPLLIYLAVSGGVCIITGLIPAPRIIYKQSVKEKFMTRIIANINSALNFSLYSINKVNLRNAGFFGSSYFNDTKYIVGDNNISGTLNDKAIEFSEVKFYKETVNYSKTIGGCLLSIILLPVFIIRGLLTSTHDDDDVPIFGVIKDEHVFYKGLFMFADLKLDFSSNFLLIPDEKLKNTAQFSTEGFGKPLSALKLEQVGFANNYTLFCTNKNSEKQILESSIISAIQNTYLKANLKPILSVVKGNVYMTIPNQGNFLNFNVAKKVGGSAFFEPYINEFERFQKFIESITSQSTK